MRWLIFGALILWAIFGHPSRDIAGWFWEYDAAPWERVDAFYYPDRTNLAVFNQHSKVGGVEECRSWASEMAAANGDRGMNQGDYECGVGEPTDWNGLKVYRTTVD